MKNSKIRPSPVVNISVNIFLKTVTSIDEKNNIMTSDSYFSARWNDPGLIWDKTNEDFGENPHVFIPSSSIWMPGS